MDQERSEVREVEDARRRVADDVRSVAENANIVERAKQNVQGRIDDVKDSVGERVDGVRDRVSDVRDRMADARDTLQQKMQGMSRGIPLPGDNPLGMLLAGLAVGFLIGLLLPVTRFETERLGPVAEDMKGRIDDARSEVMRRGGEVIKETLDAARETATNSIRQQGRDLGMSDSGSGLS